MSNHNGYAWCPVCLKERQTTGGGMITSHRRWNGTEMVQCEGSLQEPAVRGW